MSPDTILLLLGGGLLLIAVIGGGLEIKEVKIPSLGVGTRTLAGVSGAILIAIGLFALPLHVGPAGDKLVTPPGPADVSFSISDHLGDGQVSEQVRILINGQEMGTITVNEYHPDAKMRVTVPGAGQYNYVVQGTAVFRNDQDQLFEATGIGQGIIEVANKKHFDLTAYIANNTWLIYLEESDQ